jgi:hypothetical protein
MRDRFARGETRLSSVENGFNHAWPQGLPVTIETDSRRTIGYIGCGVDYGKEKVSVIYEGQAIAPDSSPAWPVRLLPVV